MTTKIAGISGIIAGMLAVTSLQANPITGSIAMGGEFDLNNVSLGSATEASGWPLVYVLADSGSFKSIPAFTAVSMAPSAWVFAPEPGQSLNALWNVGGFTFDFTGDSVNASGNFLSVNGYGTISANGYDSTPFTWNLSAEEPANGGGPWQFAFSAAAGAAPGGGSVPDGGLTVAFLGLALAGIEGLRRKVCKA